jgi:hypothetical protein
MNPQNQKEKFKLPYSKRNRKIIVKGMKSEVGG